MTPSLPKKAMLLAAGLGERLRPLTLTTPKPLISVGGRPLIEYNLILLKKFGVQDVMINLHHLGDKIRHALGDGTRFGLRISYSEEPSLLGTGGGVKAVESFFAGKPFFLLNADTLIDLNLEDLFLFHRNQASAATLVVTPALREDVSRFVHVLKEDRIGAIDRDPPAGRRSRPFVFTGAQIIESQVLRELPENAPSCIVSQGYLSLLKKGFALSAFLFEGYWRDLGTKERYEEVKKEFEETWPYTTLRPEDFEAS